MGFVKQMVWPGLLPWEIRIPVQNATLKQVLNDADRSRPMFETLVFIRQGGTNVYEETF